MTYATAYSRAHHLGAFNRLHPYGDGGSIHELLVSLYVALRIPW
jgi:hypothetical protein